MVERDPDFAALPAAVPPYVVPVLRLCLHKDPKQRTGDMRDVRLAIEGAFETTAPQVVAQAPRRGRLAAFVAVGAAAALVGAGASALWSVWRTPAADVRSVQFEIVEPPGENIFSNTLSVSPDGRDIAFVAIAEDGRSSSLWLRAADSVTARPLPGTSGAGWAIAPFVAPGSSSSPGGRWQVSNSVDADPRFLHNFDVTRDGQRFVVQLSSPDVETKVTVVTSWQSALSR